MRRALSLCVAMLGVALAFPAAAQKDSPPNRVGRRHVRHDDEHVFAPVLAAQVDKALANLMSNLSKANLKAEALDTASLEKVLREKLQGLKPPDKLKLVTSGVCDVIDPQDPGGYWEVVDVRFDNFGQEHAWQENLDVDQTRFALSKPPTAEVKYVLQKPGIDDGRARPFRRDARVLTDYHTLIKVTVTMDGRATQDNASETYYGEASIRRNPARSSRPSL